MSLGTQGASPLFAIKTKQILESAGYEIMLLNQARVGKIGFNFNYSYNKKINKFLIMANWGRAEYIERVLRLFDENFIEVVILLFPHPWDLEIQRRTAKSLPHVKFIRILHDAKRHPGDFWPGNKWINKSMKVDAVVCLSTFVTRQILGAECQIFTGAHPSFPVEDLSLLNPRGLKLDFEYDLIIGRNRKYQNVSGTTKVWVSIFGGSSRKLVVAGPARKFENLRRKPSINVIRLARTFSDPEFQYLVSRARSLICFYQEASQSGVVAMAQTLGVPVFVSNIGALPEQILSYGGGMVISELNQLTRFDFARYEKANTDRMNETFLNALTSALTSLAK